MSDIERVPCDISWGEEIPSNFQGEAPQRPVLHYKEVEQDAKELAEKLESLLGSFTSESYHRDKSTYKYLFSECLSLLMRRYIIVGAEELHKETG